MKTKKIISALFTSMLTVALSFTINNSYAQSCCQKNGKTEDCCMMKEGKMCMMKDGKVTPMTKDTTLKNGTKCMVNGECIMKDGTKMKMKEGQCMDMSGNMQNCGMNSKNENKKETAAYSCPMHPEVTSDKPGKCPKCGMDLNKKK